jgi:hypothetical protein
VTSPAPPIPLDAPIDPRRVLDVWVRLVRDERLYREFTAGRHRESAGELGLSGEDVAILDEFRARPGTRWNVDNHRFRATDHVSVRLTVWLPLTVHVLTGGSEDWLNDLVFEYLAHHEWNDFGPYQLTECERFIQFVRERVMLRRTWNPRLEPVLDFELAVIQLLKQTRDVPPEEWPALPSAGDDVIALRPRPGPVVRIVELPIDLRPWLEAADPAGIDVPLESTHYLVFVPSLKLPHRVQTIGEGARVVFEQCTGERTVAEIAGALDEEYELEPAATRAAIARWLEAGALRA